ncbi:unnamed protein product, partial [Rotaria magnacalcarata]
MTVLVRGRALSDAKYFTDSEITPKPVVDKDQEFVSIYKNGIPTKIFSGQLEQKPALIQGIINEDGPIQTMPTVSIKKVPIQLVPVHTVPVHAVPAIGISEVVLNNNVVMDVPAEVPIPKAPLL